MTVELQWFYNGEEIDENLHPLAMQAGTTYALKLKNIGSTTAVNVGFYLSQASIDPLAEIGNVYLSSHGIEIDLHEILLWGAVGSGEGYFIYQGGIPVVATTTLGNSGESPIPLTQGSGTNNDEIAPDEEVDISVLFVSSEPAQRKYVNLETYYEEE